MSDQPTERDVEALARLLARVDVNPHAAALDRARAILTSEWFAASHIPLPTEDTE